TWNLTNTNVIVYQTGVAEPNFTGATLRIWDGPPGVAGSNIIFGDETTNRFAEARAINAYRIFNTVVNPNTPGTTRSLWEVSINSAVSLSAGTYWVDWSTQIQGNPAHFAPAVTIPNSRTQPGWNARQFDAGTLLDWWDIVDDG